MRERGGEGEKKREMDKERGREKRKIDVFHFLPPYTSYICDYFRLLLGLREVHLAELAVKYGGSGQSKSRRFRVRKGTEQFSVSGRRRSPPLKITERLLKCLI